MKTTRLRPAYKLGIYYTDIWSLDISNKVEVFEPVVIPPTPCVFTQRVVIGPEGIYGFGFPYPGQIRYLAFPYYPNLEEADGFFPTGMLKYGPPLLHTLGIETGVGGFVYFSTVRKLFGIIYEGKEINRLTHPDDFFYDETPSGYPVVKSFGWADPEHPFYDLCTNPKPAGTVLEFQFILL